MNGDQILLRFIHIDSLIEQINSESMAKGKLQPVFRLRYNPPLEFTCYEAGFLKTVSWLYMLYYEAGRADIGFVLDKLKNWDMDAENRFNHHYQLIHTLRTVLQHSINLDEPRNQNKKKVADDWFILHFRTSHLTTRQQWKKSLIILVVEACSFIERIAKVIMHILDHVMAEELIRSWNQYSSHFHEPFEYDEIIHQVSYEIGIQVDVVKHRNKYYESWSKRMVVLPTGYDFHVEARKLVQRTLMDDPQIPITSRDIIQALSIPPGQLVGYYIRQATNIYLNEPCSKDELIEQLRNISLPTQLQNKV